MRGCQTGPSSKRYIPQNIIRTGSAVDVTHLCDTLVQMLLVIRSIIELGCFFSRLYQKHRKRQRYKYH